VQRSSVVGEKGMPLKLILYFADPPFTADPSGTAKSIQRVASLPWTGGDGLKPCPFIVKAVRVGSQATSVATEALRPSEVNRRRNILLSHVT
jgi:hypothetical protein